MADFGQLVGAISRLFDILYADDTLLLGTSAEDVGHFAATVE